MAKINIDNKEYDLGDLSDETKSTIASLQFAQEEIAKLEARIAVYKTAARAYTIAIRDGIDN